MFFLVPTQNPVIKGPIIRKEIIKAGLRQPWGMALLRPHQKEVFQGPSHQMGSANNHQWHKEIREVPPAHRAPCHSK
ncbi:hypothetical protein C5O22_04705 [Treponema sp. J25]|nr:hypothetical protein C5O22_04705 [Treponema sp. J25]